MFLGGFSYLLVKSPCLDFAHIGSKLSLKTHLNPIYSDKHVQEKSNISRQAFINNVTVKVRVGKIVEEKEKALNTVDRHIYTVSHSDAKVLIF